MTHGADECVGAREQEPVTSSVTPCKIIRLKLDTHQFWMLDAGCGCVPTRNLKQESGIDRNGRRGLRRACHLSGFFLHFNNLLRL